MFRTREELTKENILKYISEEDIFRKYISHNFNLGESFKSPLRDDDDTPSFNVYYNHEQGRVLYKDFGRTSGSAFTFVMELYHLTFTEALIKINNDFNLGLLPKYITKNLVVTNKPTIIAPRVIVEPKKVVIKLFAYTRSFTQKDLEYWASFGITLPTLKKFNVYAIYKLFTANYLKWTHSEDNPIYGYYFKKTLNIKAYRPFAPKGERWSSDLDSRVDLQGYDQLPETGEILIITKAMKDVMTLYELGYNAVAPTSENSVIPKEKVLELLSRFKIVYSLYDRDKTGVINARKLWKEYGIIPLFVPKKLACKDISDARKLHGEQITKKLLP